MSDGRTAGAIFAGAVARDPARPLLTFYDDASQERTELSGATLANWVAKTANMIVDDCALEPGQRASVGLPPHWQTAAVLLGCWTAGLAVSAAPDPSEVAFVAFDRTSDEWPATDRYALGLHPLGLPLPMVPDGYLDFTTEVRAHGDHFSAPVPVTPRTMAWRAGVDLDQADLCALADARACTLGITAGARVLIDVDAHPDPVDWLLAPLSVGASTVLCRRMDATKLDGRVAAERVTHQVVS